MGWNGLSCFSNIRGVCLSELVVSVATGAMVLAAAFDMFHIVQTRAAAQQRSLTQQQDLRLALEVFEQEVRLTAAEAIIAVQPDQFLFLANLSGQQTTTTGAVLPGQSTLAVQDGSGWSEGKTVTLCGRQACEVHRLLLAGQRFQLTLVEPVESMFPAGASVQVSNRVAYYTKHDEHGVLNLMRVVDGGANVLVGGLNEAHFSYRDERGHITQRPSEARRVLIEMEPSHLGHRIVREVAFRS
jgi:type II secretory pathway component PulJ